MPTNEAKSIRVQEAIMKVCRYSKSWTKVKVAALEALESEDRLRSRGPLMGHIQKSMGFCDNCEASWGIITPLTVTVKIWENGDFEWNVRCNGGCRHRGSLEEYIRNWIPPVRKPTPMSNDYLSLDQDTNGEWELFFQETCKKSAPKQRKKISTKRTKTQMKPKTQTLKYNESTEDKMADFDLKKYMKRLSGGRR